MIVKELIEILEKMPQGATVFLYDKMLTGVEISTMKDGQRTVDLVHRVDYFRKESENV